METSGQKGRRLGKELPGAIAVEQGCQGSQSSNPNLWCPQAEAPGFRITRRPAMHLLQLRLGPSRRFLTKDQVTWKNQWGPQAIKPSHFLQSLDPETVFWVPLLQISLPDSCISAAVWNMSEPLTHSYLASALDPLTLPLALLQASSCLGLYFLLTQSCVWDSLTPNLDHRTSWPEVWYTGLRLAHAVLWLLALVSGHMIFVNPWLLSPELPRPGHTCDEGCLDCNFGFWYPFQVLKFFFGLSITGIPYTKSLKYTRQIYRLMWTDHIEYEVCWHCKTDYSTCHKEMSYPR